MKVTACRLVFGGAGSLEGSILRTAVGGCARKNLRSEAEFQRHYIHQHYRVLVTRNILEFVDSAAFQTNKYSEDELSIYNRRSKTCFNVR